MLANTVKNVANSFRMRNPTKAMVYLFCVMGVVWGGNIGCGSPTLASDSPTPIQEHPIEFLADKQIDIHIPSKCPVGMVMIDRKDHSYCIDQYEFPNQAGVCPVAALTAYEAVNLCASVGKRICEYNEWHQACLGKEHFLYSYGPVHRDYCNDHALGYIQPQWYRMFPLWSWKLYAKGLYRGVPSGSEPLCKSDEGVYEMLGNVREWTHDPNSMYGYVVPSGYWFGTMQGLPTCNFRIQEHAPGFASYEFGTRCCKSLD